jgi:hypothetical protein
MVEVRSRLANWCSTIKFSDRPYMKKQIITGIVGRGGAHVSKAVARQGEDLTARVWFPMSMWRVEDGQVEQGERRLFHVGKSLAPDGQAWQNVLREGRLVRVEAWFQEKPHAVNSDQGDWHFGQLVALDPNDDGDLSPMAVDVTAVSEPTESWHIQKLAQRAIAHGAKCHIDDLKTRIVMPSDGSWAAPAPVSTGPNTVMGSGAVGFTHRSHGQPEGLGKGRNAQVYLRYKGDDLFLWHTCTQATKAIGFLLKCSKW